MKRGRGGEEVETVDINMAHVLMLLSREAVGVAEAHQTPGRVFECKTCNRQFPSFQALGGHRASHKKPKLLDDQAVGRPSTTKPRVHECSICGLEFSLGQALGGHMRRHRVTTPDGLQITTTHGTGHGGGVVDAGGEKGGGHGHEKRVQLQAPLDLNLTPMENDAELRLLTFSLGPPLVL